MDNEFVFWICLVCAQIWMVAMLIGERFEFFALSVGWFLLALGVLVKGLITWK